MRSIVTMALVLSIAGRAAAQSAEPATPPLPPEELSESMAVGLSLGTTLVSWVALVTTLSVDEHNKIALPITGLAVMAAPSLGHWYAGSPWTRGLALRAAGLLSFGLAASRVST